MSYATAADGCRIFYEDIGSGAPCLLIPGLGGESAFWSGLVPLLAAERRVILVDHRGAGKSDRPSEGYTLPQIALDMYTVLDQLGLEAAHLIGHSTGGMVAQIMAVIDAPRVSSLVLSGTWGRVDRRFRRMFEARLALLQHAGPEAYQKLTQALGYDVDWIEAHGDALDADLRLARSRFADPSIQLARLSMLLECDVFDNLDGVCHPALVIGAPDDALIPFRSSEILSERLPNARLRTLSGGHFFPKSYPAPYAEMVREFYRELGQ